VRDKVDRLTDGPKKGSDPLAFRGSAPFLGPSLTDLSYLHVLQKHHPRAVAVSAVTGQGLDALREAVMEMLSEDFAEVEIEVDASNGRVLAYLAAHAEIYRQEFQDSRVTLRCYLPRYLVHHIQEPDVRVRAVEHNGAGNNAASPGCPGTPADRS